MELPGAVKEKMVVEIAWLAEKVLSASNDHLGRKQPPGLALLAVLKAVLG